MPDSNVTYDAVRAAVLQSGSDARVEVNQRALIDKILARYASQGAVYRELLQNSNDADAQKAEIHFTTTQPPPSSNTSKPHVSQVVYRNDGKRFTSADWSRLRNIAEGNPDVSKVGAFGVGAYTMFSVCEQPLIISGSTALAFAWKGDALWARSAPAPEHDPVWTSFVLPSRDLYPLPDVVSFAQFLCAGLTFTNSLKSIRLFIDESLVLTISKASVGSPTLVTPPRASSWWANDGMNTTSPNEIFTLTRTDAPVTQSLVDISVSLNGHQHSIRARYVSALAQVHVPSNMQRRIHRVTKKNPPRQVHVHIFIDAAAGDSPPNNEAALVLSTFSPPVGAGRVFIGFRTSQTTGLAAHLAAPLVPTVEREAIDFQDPALNTFNSDLLFLSGTVMRLTFEHAMSLIASRWQETAPQRDKDLKELQLKKQKELSKPSSAPQPDSPEEDARPANDGVFGFVRFMTSGVRRLAEAISTVDPSPESDDLFNPPDLLPLTSEERDAIMLMRAFSPEHSTPDANVGAYIADGFTSCMSKQKPPVLTKSGVVRASDARLPSRGIEYFVQENVVRKVVVDNASTFLKHVAGCRELVISDLVDELRGRSLSEEDFTHFLKWWVKMYRSNPGNAALISSRLREVVTFVPKVSVQKETTAAGDDDFIRLKSLTFYATKEFSSETLPLPSSVLPRSIQEEISLRALQDAALSNWIKPLPFSIWASYVVSHDIMKQGRKQDASVRLEILKMLSDYHGQRYDQARVQLETWLRDTLGKWRCIPFESSIATTVHTDYPADLYLPNAEIGIFEGLGSFRKVSGSLQRAGVSPEFLIGLGVRKAISIDFLFTQLDNLKWNDNPEPLIRYLRSATLSKDDLAKLKTSQYLPEVKDKSRTYSPFELFIPNDELLLFPFLKILQWPSSSQLHERSPDRIFLKTLGCQETPPLPHVLKFISNELTDLKDKVRCLEFVAKRLGPLGVYSSSFSGYREMEFLPAVRRNPFEDGNSKKVTCSPLGCYSNPDTMCMGLAVLDPEIDKGSSRMLAERFRCLENPTSEKLVEQMLNLVNFAQRKATAATGGETLRGRVLPSFRVIFRYMASRSNSLSEASIVNLQSHSFIPLVDGDGLKWFKPSEVYFKSSDEQVGSLLFQVVEFDAFLATMGVQSEPSISDLLNLVVMSPSEVLRKLGAENYLALLRRLAAATPGSKITRQMRQSPFLLGHNLREAEESDNSGESTTPSSPIVEESSKVSNKEIYSLAKAEDICIIDNSFFARMFSVLTAPQESDLERFYESLGSVLISNRVNQDYRVSAHLESNTQNAKKFAANLAERSPLLVSSNVTSRPLKKDAAMLLSEDRLSIIEARSVTAEYSLKREMRRHEVTCCVKRNGRKSILYITQKVDWFDVGNAIGQLILQRCQLEDAFFIGSILEAPLSQLRARGFPVDRILKNLNHPEVEVKPFGSENTGKEVVPSQVGSQSQSLQTSSIEDQSGREGQRDEQGSSREMGGKEGKVMILKQMFPTCDTEYIRQLLGPEPTLEKMKEVADSLVEGGYPEEADKGDRGKGPRRQLSIPEKSGAHKSNNQLKRVRNLGGSLLNRALRGIQKGGESPGLNAGIQAVSQGQGTAGTAGTGTIPGLAENEDHNRPVPLDEDKTAHDSIESALRRAANATTTVSRQGFSSSSHDPTNVVSDTPNLDSMMNASSMEHNLLPFIDNLKCPNGVTRNGVRVFSSGNSIASRTFLLRNWDSVQRFAMVLQHLCNTFGVAKKSSAIFHEEAGRTVAFNAGRALHFNIRYFVALHDSHGDGTQVDASCYSYWFTTMAHELAHNLVSEHNQQHGFYTESFVSTHMPKLGHLLPTFLREARQSRQS